MRSWLLAALAIAPGATRDARAQDDIDDVRVRATVWTGLALALADYETNGVAVPIRVGADVSLPRTGPLRHRLVLAVEYAHFSRWLITAPEVLPGLQLDVASVRGTWRVSPLPGRGLHVDAGLGIGVLHDRLRMALPGRRVASSETLAVVPLELGLGWTIGRHVDLGVRYAHAVAISGDGGDRALGQLGLALGVRR